MLYDIRHISELLKGKFLNSVINEMEVTEISFDSRKITQGSDSVFFALQGLKSDGHDYLDDAYAQGIRNFVVSKNIKVSDLPGANIIKVVDTLEALHKLAAHHRASLDIPFIAITGSNGKTVVKEWLALALQEKRNVDKTPLSYNSQIGVPYSILSLENEIDLAIIEAGISEKNEMAKLETIIQPHIGIFTNLGDAHNSGFIDEEEKLQEKIFLFSSAELIIYNEDQTLVAKKIRKSYPYKSFSWGKSALADLHLEKKQSDDRSTIVKLRHGKSTYELSIPFTDTAFLENSLTVIAYLILDGWNEKEIQAILSKFSALPNRLEIRKGINNCTLVNDSYSSDLTSTRLALSQLDQYGTDNNKIAFLSALDHQKDDVAYLDLINNSLTSQKINQLIAIGFSKETHWSSNEVIAYPDTESCLKDFDFDSLSDSSILIKGATKFQLGKIVNRLTSQVSDTILETNLSAIAHNLNVYRKKLKPDTMIMAVIKAQAYGSGSSQMVHFLANQKIDYLGVALVDEAIALRKQGCNLPIMIFNVQLENLGNLWQYDLEPEVFSFELLQALFDHAKTHGPTKKLPIHLKIDSGMHRLGFISQDLPLLLAELKDQSALTIKSIFSHLSASESPEHDSFTHTQFKLYDTIYDNITDILPNTPFKHILNTSGITRFSDFQYDLVRLGLGLYGIDDSMEMTESLIKAHTLKAVILQIKRLEKGESTGYSRSGRYDKEVDIAILSIGYADGLMRAAGNGAHSVLIGDDLCPTIGNICMDVCMVVLPELHGAKVGDQALIYGPNHPVESLATACNTITYEVISRISPRVKRTYIQD